MMLNEYDVVKAKRNLSDKVSKGYIGTIVMAYENPRLAYEVEFFDSKNETIDILTVETEDIISININI